MVIAERRISELGGKSRAERRAERAERAERVIRLSPPPSSSFGGLERLVGDGERRDEGRRREKGKIEDKEERKAERREG